MFTVQSIILPIVIAPRTSTSFDVSFSAPTIGLKTATVNIASDDCNEAFYDFAIQALVEDVEAPTISCPTVAPTYDLQPGSCFAVLNLQATATDNCVTPPVITNDAPENNQYFEGNTIVSFTATDAAGLATNCSITVSVHDQTPPIVYCPQAITIDCAISTMPSSTGFATSNDVCGVTEIDFEDIVTQNESICSQFEYNILRVWTATDPFDNESSCTQYIRVEDRTPPTLTCPDNITIECDESDDIANTGIATAIDNCSVDFVLDLSGDDQELAECLTAKITYEEVGAPGETGCPQHEYSIERTWTAVDNLGNKSSCVQTITVEDNTPPVLTCPESVTIQCGSDDTPAALGMAIAEDNCTISLMEVNSADNFVHDGSNNPSTGVLTRTWNVQDECTNAAAPCEQIITIIDTEKPILYCDDIDIEADLEPGACDVFVELIVPEVEDACGEEVELVWRSRLTDEDGNNLLPWTMWMPATEAYALFEEGFYKIQWKATDLSQNRIRCLTYLVVNDLDGLPCPWYNNHVDCDGGSTYDYDAETFTLSSEDCHNSVSDNDDEYAFVSQVVCGNATIIAQITDVSGNSNGFAGITMRENSDVGSKMVTLLSNGNSNHRKEIRTITNGNVTSQLSTAFNRHWLKIVRTNNSFKGYTSSNGSSWFLKFSHTISMNSCIELGLVLNGYTASSDVEATFANVSLTGPNVAAFQSGLPQVAALESDPGMEVYPTLSNGLLTVTVADYLDTKGVLEVLDVNGVVIYTTGESIIEELQYQVDLSRQPAGVYLVRLRLANGKEQVKRVVLQY